MNQLNPVDTLVIGSGPGGYMAALRSAQHGIIERDQIGGVCTHAGCIPSKALIAESHRYNEHKQWSSAVASISFENAQAFKQIMIYRSEWHALYPNT